MRIKMIAIATGVGALLMIGTAYAATSSTQDFVTQASVANQFEIESSKVALEKSHNDQVKAFAQRMVEDHSKIGDEFKQALQSSGTRAKPADDLDDKHQKLVDQLQSDPDQSFDRDYISMQTKAHKQAVSLFSGYAKNGKDQTIRDFAAQTLPTLKDHLAQVKELKANE